MQVDIVKRARLVSQYFFDAEKNLLDKSNHLLSIEPKMLNEQLNSFRVLRVQLSLTDYCSLITDYWSLDASHNALSATCNRLQLILYLAVNISATVSEDENATKGNFILKPSDFNAVFCDETVVVKEENKIQGR